MGDEEREETGTVEDLTLNDLLSLAPGDFRDPSLAAGVECKDLQALHKKLLALPLPIAWSSVKSKLAEMISDALNTSLLSVWTSAWEKYQGLMDDVEKSRKSPRVEVLSLLAEHSMESTLHPYLEIFLGPEKIQKIRFDVTLTTRIKGLELGIKNGRMKSLQLAECEWSGRIGIGEFTLVERDLTKLSLLGRIQFRRGIPLGPEDDE